VLESPGRLADSRFSIASVAATSKGNLEEDRVVERAIRASVLALNQASKDGHTSNDAITKAIKASVTEATAARSSAHLDGSGTDDEALEQALRRSITHEARERRSGFEGADFDDSGIDSDSDENMKNALRQSKSDTTYDAEVEKAIKLSQLQSNPEDAELARAMKESLTGIR